MTHHGPQTEAFLGMRPTVVGRRRQVEAVCAARCSAIRTAGTNSTDAYLRPGTCMATLAAIGAIGEQVRASGGAARLAVGWIGAEFRVTSWRQPGLTPEV